MSAIPEEITPQIRFLLTTGKETRRLTLDPDIAYGLFRPFLASLLIGRDSDTREQKRLIQLVRTGVKGILLISGEHLLTALFGTNDHPKPGKGEDLVDWYSDMFAKIAIAASTKCVFLVSAEEEGHDHETITITGLSTVSDSIAKGSGFSPGQEEERGQIRPSIACDTCS